MQPLNPSNNLEKKNYSLKKRSYNKSQSSKEYMEARFIHDRFCKFEAPFHGPTAIQTIRLIREILPNPEALKTAELPFKLNSLRWFLTSEGKKFLAKQENRYQLDLKRAALNLAAPPEIPLPLEIKNNPNDLNQIVTQMLFEYSEKRIGEDREYKKEKKSISDFLS